MKIPNRNRAKVSKKKILNYLLSETHPLGKFKSKFFRGLGFNEKNVPLFQKALLDLLKNNEVTETMSSLFGTKYIVDGKIGNPKHKMAIIRSVWIIEIGQSTPAFVTAYPN